MTLHMGSIASVVAVAAALVSVSAMAAPVNILSPSDSPNIVGIHVDAPAGVATLTADSIVGSQGLGWWQWTLPGPSAVSDGNVGTKYLNYGQGDSAGKTATKGVGTGFYVTPLVGPTVVTGFMMATANDTDPRDPLTIALQGSNSTGTDLLTGANWTPIYSGITGLTLARSTWGPEQDFANSSSFTSYRLIVTSQRASANAAAYSEVQLISVPEPASLGFLGLMSVGLLIQRRRKA